MLLPLLKLGAREVPQTPKHHSLLPSLLELGGEISLLKTPHRNQADTDLEVSSLLAGFHSAGRCSACCQRRKGITNLTYSAVNTVCCDKHGRQAQQRHSAMGVTNRFLIVLKAHSMSWNPCLLPLPATTERARKPQGITYYCYSAKAIVLNLGVK